MIDSAVGEDEVAAEFAFAGEACAFEDSLGSVVVDRAAGLDPVEGAGKEELGQEEADSSRHDAAALKGRRQGEADLTEAMLPVGYDQRDPAGRCSSGLDYPLKPIASRAVEVVYVLRREIGADVGDGDVAQRLMLANARLRSPGAEEGCVRHPRWPNSDPFGTRIGRDDHGPLVDRNTRTFSG